ncbi:MAG: glycosyltransferase family 2 protein [Oscillospiraceae bacterium]|jgi:undecaprenyl-phosphate 4-deoxy-4-formamido-L-arabinose transferase|nr:glycosyltransferase family 2 protein [Oscillospiraceae bacterium]
MKKISFVIPCYGSEHTIKAVIDEIDVIMGQKPEYGYEIICVNDCSPDNVLAVLKSLTKTHQNLTVIDLARNFGKNSALLAGMSLISGDILTVLDDDGQCPTYRLWDLIDKLNDGFDIVTAKYINRKQSLAKKIGSAVNHAMSQWLLNKPKDLHFGTFNVMRRFVVDEITKYHNPYPYFEGLMLRSTHKIGYVIAEDRERFSGEGHYTFIKSLGLWLNGFTAFSVKPLRLSAFAGCFAAAIGFVYGLVTIIQKIITPAMPMGYASTMAALLFIGGMILLSLGLIGEYVGRIYVSINNSPQYVIREMIRGGKEQ